jgi:hypothetical protein
MAIATACMLAGCGTPAASTDDALFAQYEGAAHSLSGMAATKPKPTEKPTPEPTYYPTPEPTYYPTPEPTPKQDCCKVTGGGFITMPDKYGEDLRINFGFNAQFGPDGQPRGHVNVVAHVEGPGNLHFRSDEVLNILCELTPGTEHPRLEGRVEVFGTLEEGGTFILVVNDSGEPGVDDTFEFSADTDLNNIPDFAVSGTLVGGNIQIHRETCD